MQGNLLSVLYVGLRVLSDIHFTYITVLCCAKHNWQYLCGATLIDRWLVVWRYGGGAATKCVALVNSSWQQSPLALWFIAKVQVQAHGKNECTVHARVYIVKLYSKYKKAILFIFLFLFCLFILSLILSSLWFFWPRAPIYLQWFWYWIIKCCDG